MKKRELGDWIKAYMAYSSHSEAPDKFHFWTAVATIAGALRRRVWIDQAYFQWTPNFYIIFVAPPGIVSKSTTLSIGMQLLKKVRGVQFGPDAITWQALTESLAGSTEMVKMPHDNKMHPMSCLTIASSEFGTFFNPKDREMVDVLVSLWDGQLGVWEKKTKTQGGDRIANPWINIAACTTPAWIAGAFPKYLVGGGFTSRCVWVYAEEKRRLVAYPGAAVPIGFQEERDRLIKDLAIIADMRGPMTLSPEAAEYGQQWYEDHYADKNHPLNTDQFAGYLARKQTHIHKLAIVLSAARSSSLIIERDALEAAAAIVTSLEADMPKVFANIGLEKENQAARDILQIVKNFGKITEAKLLQICYQFMTSTVFKEAIGGLLHAQLINRRQEGAEIIITPRYEKVVSEIKTEPNPPRSASGEA